MKHSLSGWLLRCGKWLTLALSMGGTSALVFGLTPPLLNPTDELVPGPDSDQLVARAGLGPNKQPKQKKPNDSKKSIYYIAHQEYETECGSCHIAFLPGFLPKRSWTKMMADLENHFGENAGLDPEPNGRILNYLTEHAADSSRASPRSRRIGQLIAADDVPLRITETPFWVRRHGSVRDWVFKRPEVTSKSKCDSCHRDAKTGVFDAESVVVPRGAGWPW